MKKIFYSILICILLQINTVAQNYWTQTPMDHIINDMQSNSAGEIFAVGGLVFRSSDGGLSWTTLNLGIPNPPSVLSLGISNDDILFVGTWGGVFRSLDNGNNWMKIDSTMGNVTDFAFNNSATLFIASTNGVFKSTDNGDSWQQLSSYLTGQIEIDKNTERLYATFNISTYLTTIYVSTDDGNTWSPANNGLTNGSATVTLSVNSQGHIFAGTMYNGVFRSTDEGNNWLSINYGMASNQEWVRDFAFDQTNKIFAVSSGNVNFSTNNGDTWGVVNRGIQGGWYIRMTFVAETSLIISWFEDYIPGVGYPTGLAHRSDFSTSALPPNLISPFNHATEVGTNPILKWNAAALPSTYRVQVARNSTFTQVVFDTAGIQDTIIQIFNLQQGLDYYWRVNESNDEGRSGWSHTWHFITTYPPISPPTLLLPLNGANNVSNNPTLVWSFVPSIAYAVQIASDSNFITIIYQDTVAIDTSVNVMNLSYETKYYWRVQTIRSDSTSNWSLSWNFTTTIVGITSELNELPKVVKLSSNYPNPFNPSTVISYQLPITSNVTLKVYDILGREVAILINEEKPAGSYEVQFTGNGLTSGIYFYKLSAGDYSETKKMILLR